uniref:Endoplasmic reticulum lectin n=1 Tax=Denticeps clupeoides TaxID=299321 RepID=A0AAY4ABS2_9TELE
MAAAMTVWLWWSCGALWLCLLSASAFLNLEELTEMKYGIQILPEPVVMGQTQDVLLVSSKYRQHYECRLPAQALLFQFHPPSETPTYSYSGPPIPELLQPMSSAPCLTKTKDWWTYEFCYGQHIRQYHMEDSEIKGEVLFLGYYSSEFDWTNETAKASKHHKLKRYHSQSYVNGSKCDLNGSPRETEVRFVCEEGSVDYVARVDEPQSCRYVVTVHTSRPCSHPLLRPPPSTRPQPIICQPALSPQQYMDYVKAQVSDTKRKVQQISEELEDLDKMLSKDEEVEGRVEDLTEGTASTGTAEDQQHQLHEKEVVFEEEKFNFKIISDPADLMKFVQHLRSSHKKVKLNVSCKNKKCQYIHKRYIYDGHDDEDEKLLQEFEEEMADISIPSEKRGEIKEEMQKEFNNIIDEAQQELESEGLKGEFDRSQAAHTLENTLDKLLDRLEDKDEEPLTTQTQTEEELAESHTHLKVEEKTKEIRIPVPTPGLDAEGNQVKIRVTKFKLGAVAAGAAAAGGDVAVQELGESDPQWQQIQDTVREQLERAGVKAKGKIEVKILSRGMDDEHGDQWFSEEDTKSFRDLLINLLTGGTEEVYKEQKRLQELEDNYRFVWGTEKSEDSQSESSDTEDLEL